jgi:hypothetical protein
MMGLAAGVWVAGCAVPTSGTDGSGEPSAGKADGVAEFRDEQTGGRPTPISTEQVTMHPGDEPRTFDLDVEVTYRERPGPGRAPRRPATIRIESPEIVVPLEGRQAVYLRAVHDSVFSEKEYGMVVDACEAGDPGTSTCTPVALPAEDREDGAYWTKLEVAPHVGLAAGTAKQPGWLFYDIFGDGTSLIDRKVDFTKPEAEEIELRVRLVPYFTHGEFESSSDENSYKATLFVRDEGTCGAEGESCCTVSVYRTCTRNHGVSEYECGLHPEPRCMEGSMCSSEGECIEAQ